LRRLSAFAGLALFALSASAAQPAKPPSQRLLDAEAVFSGGSGNPLSKLNVFLEEADAGSAAAKRDLGLVYRYYRNDPLLSLQWFEAAAVAGDARARSYIGDFYLDKKNGAPDPANAMYWYTQGYQRSDARATIALAAFSCTGAKVDLHECGHLLDAATKFSKSSDPADVRPSLQLALFKLGAAYQAGKVVPRNPAAAETWYGKSAALGYADAALAQAKLYIEPHGLPRNPARATAITDAIASYETTHKAGWNRMIPDNGKIAAVYNEIGALYERRNTATALRLAAALYVKASALGYGKPAVALAARYADGVRTPRNLAAAYNLLMAVIHDAGVDGDNGAHAALEHLVTLLKASPAPGDAQRVALAEKALSPHLVPVPPRIEEADAVSTPPPAPMAERYPNISGPPNDTATAGQTFSVQVSLNAIAFDAGTQILSGNQANGQLQIALPAGMTQMPIQVDLIVPPGVTFVNGDTNSSSLILDSATPNSTPAVFHLQAGSAPSTGLIRATLSYHQNFLAQVARPLAIVAATPNDIANPTPPQPPVPPDNNASPTGRADNGPLVNNAIVPHVGKLDPGPNTRTLLPPKPLPRPEPVVIDPTEQSPDLTIIESLDGDTLHYTFLSVVGATSGDVPNAAALKLKIQGYFDKLQSQSLILSQGGGVMCANARAKGGNTTNACGDALLAQATAQGIGEDLFQLDAPQQFRTAWQQFAAGHIRVHSVAVVSDDPTLPWELMLPDKGTSNFLGLTASIVRINTGSPQGAQSSVNSFDGIAVVIPAYDGAKALPATQTELKAITTEFPQAKAVEGDTPSVSALVRSAPPSIIHYSGHGQSVPLPAGSPATLAPDTALLLEDNSITPDQLVAFRDQGRPAHPFYFFNACDLGVSQKELNYISGWAPALMQSGASGYLGALYTIGDASAASFASHFYTDLKASLATDPTATMADIVTQARKQTYAEANDPTALAYVLYAKPFMKFVAAQ
jgi:TPR repeat protein